MAGSAPHIPGCRDLSLIGERVARSLFSAWSDAAGRHVTVTVFPPLSEGRTRAGFDRAAATAQRLGAHPSVLTIHEWGHAPDGRPWIVTDPQPPESVDTLLTMDGPLEVERALQVGVLLAGALETAHRAGIVHGDLQPDRLVFGSHGEPLLVETGLAAFAVFPGLGALNNPVRYHAPPEVLERTEVTPATDVYSLATTVYALLAARAPHQKPAQVTDSNASLLLRILQMSVPSIDRPDLPAGLEDALRGPLSANPSKRPQQAIEVAWLLQDVQRRAGLAVTEPVVLDLDGAGPGAAAPAADLPHGPAVDRGAPPPPVADDAPATAPLTADGDGGSASDVPLAGLAGVTGAGLAARDEALPPPAIFPFAEGRDATETSSPPEPQPDPWAAPDLGAHDSPWAAPVDGAPESPWSGLSPGRSPDEGLWSPPADAAADALWAPPPADTPAETTDARWAPPPADTPTETTDALWAPPPVDASADARAAGTDARWAPPPADASADAGAEGTDALWAPPPADTPTDTTDARWAPPPADTPTETTDTLWAPPPADASADARAEGTDALWAPPPRADAPADTTGPAWTAPPDDEPPTRRPWSDAPADAATWPWSDAPGGAAASPWSDAPAEPPRDPAATSPWASPSTDDEPPTLWPSSWPSEGAASDPPAWAVPPVSDDEVGGSARPAGGDDGGSIADSGALGLGDAGGGTRLPEAGGTERPAELDELPAWYTDPLPNGADAPTNGHGAARPPSNGHGIAAAPWAGGADASSPGRPADPGPTIRPADDEAGGPPPRHADGTPPSSATPWGAQPTAPRPDARRLPGAGDELRSLFGEVVGEPDAPPRPLEARSPQAFDADPLGPPEERPPIDLGQLDRPLGPTPFLPSRGGDDDGRSTESARPARLPRPHEPQTWTSPGTGSAAAPPARLPRADEVEAAGRLPARPGPRQVAPAAGRRPSPNLRPSASAGPPALPVVILVAVVIVLALGVAWLVLTGDDGEAPATDRRDPPAAEDAGDDPAGTSAGASPSGLQVNELPEGIQVTWSGAADASYVVTVLSADAAPAALPATRGTSALVPNVEGAAAGGRCFTVATAGADGEPGPASEPVCTPGASAADMAQG